MLLVSMGLSGCTANPWAGDAPYTPTLLSPLRAPNPKSSPVGSGITPVNKRYSQQSLAYFDQIAFGSEFSNNPHTLRVRKWTRDLRIAVHGQPTPQDFQALTQMLGELNALMAPDGIELTLTETAPNVDIYFVPHQSFGRYEPNYVRGNLGFFYVWWNGRMELTRSRILIASDRITQRERNHLLREELTQSLGLMNDAWTYENSIFYQGWTRTQTYAEIDRDLIRILYDPRVKAGHNPNQVRQAIR